jgi:hypothetical protein
MMTTPNSPLTFKYRPTLRGVVATSRATSAGLIDSSTEAIVSPIPSQQRPMASPLRVGYFEPLITLSHRHLVGLGLKCRSRGPQQFERPRPQSQSRGQAFEHLLHFDSDGARLARADDDAFAIVKTPVHIRCSKNAVFKDGHHHLVDRIE